jgi:hypothetical protein
MSVEKPDLFKQWKMMQDIDRILAEVAAHAAAAGLDLESAREVLLANMLGEQPLPIDFRGKSPPEPKAAPVRVIAESPRTVCARETDRPGRSGSG